jgi:hypothetical protein
MSDHGPLFQSGDRVVTCGEMPRRLGKILYRSGDCPVHGDPLYLVAFKYKADARSGLIFAKACWRYRMNIKTISPSYPDLAKLGRCELTRFHSRRCIVQGRNESARVGSLARSRHRRWHGCLPKMAKIKTALGI